MSENSVACTSTASNETSDAERKGASNVSFEAVDVQATEFSDIYDYAFGRFGTMFFANPVAALRNVRSALRPGGGLNMVVWRRKRDNHWLDLGGPRRPAGLDARKPSRGGLSRSGFSPALPRAGRSGRRGRRRRGRLLLGGRLLLSGRRRGGARGSRHCRGRALRGRPVLVRRRVALLEIEDQQDDEADERDQPDQDPPAGSVGVVQPADRHREVGQQQP